jgi:hypothetical protein
VLYLHETFNLRPGRTTAFTEEFAGQYLPLMSSLDARLVDLWETASMSLPWPAAIALWEVDDAVHAQRILRQTHDTSGSQRSAFRQWHDSLESVCTSGRGRILNPGGGVPTVADLRSRGVATTVCVHETITTHPDKQGEYVRNIENLWMPSARRLGRIWVGTYQTQWRNDEAISIWALEDPWTPFPGGTAEVEVLKSPDVQEWLRLAGSFRAGFDDGIIVALPIQSS